MRIFSVDPGEPFLATLAARLLDGTLWPGGRAPDHPLAICAATVWLPTRRAARALRESFLEAAGGPTALPRIAPLGESEDGVTDLPVTSEEADAAEPRRGGEVMRPLEARVALAALVRAFAERLEAAAEPDQRVLLPTSGADAVRLADDLLSLMDQVETQEADWADLPALVDSADLAGHWQMTTRFLSIASQGWPAYLAERGRISAAAARRREAEAAAVDVASATGPVVVAGSTGSIPATRRLIGAVAQSPAGAVVLPGFDRTADAAGWQALAAAEDRWAHPQFGMAELLRALGAKPDDVAPLAPAPRHRAPRDGTMAARRTVLSAAFRPAPQTHRWLADRDAVDRAEGLRGLTLLEAEDERTEAAAIAVAMRESVEEGERVALVTPHRPLARRVTHALARHGIEVDDSAGEPLTATGAGILARLVASVAAGGDAAAWLALMKHPLAAASRRPDAIAALERRLRGPRIAPHAIAAVVAARGGEAGALARDVAGALAPLSGLAGTTASVARLAGAHRLSLDAIVGDVSGTADLAAVAGLLDRLASCDEYRLPGADWPQTFEALLDGEVLRKPLESAAVRILGPLEARLLAFDHAILGGLNEGMWPAAADPGPWMSRGMMRAFGLDLPERRIGLAAHDVYVAAHTPRVTLSRARRAGGEPTVASRWFQRLTAFAGEAAAPAHARGGRLLALAARRERLPDAKRAGRPEPRPPVAARPTRLSISDVGLLVRDPYALYARRVLDLRPLDPLEAEPDGADRGVVIHAVMKAFIEGRHHLAEDAEARFRAIAERALAGLEHAPEARALWGARLRHIAPHVVRAERARAGAFTPVALEACAEAQTGGATLHGRIDRIDQRHDGALRIVDYKTGRPPSDKQVRSLLEPQLPLEAVLVRLGALTVDRDAPLAALTYIAVASGRTPYAETAVCENDRGETPDSLAERAHQAFDGLMAHYADPASGYRSRARVPFEKESDGDYDHLARTAEWQQ